MNVNDINFERLDGNDPTHGKIFEWEVTLLMYLKCVILFNCWEKNKVAGVRSFDVVNNMDIAKKFDDVVVKVEFVHESSTVTTKLIFVQCKHAEDQLTNEKKFARFLNLDLIKIYFLAFTKIKEMFLEKLTKFANCEFTDCEFLFMSNIDSPTVCVHKKTQNVETVDHIEMVLPNNSLESEFTLTNNCDCIPPKCAAKFRTPNNVAKTEFLNAFRLFLNMNHTLKFEIIAAMNLINNEIRKSDLESLYTIILEETKHLSNSKKHWTQDTMLLDSVIAFRYLKNIADTFVDKYRGKIKISSSPNLEKTIENTYTTNSSRLNKLKLYKFLSELSLENSLIVLHNEEDIVSWVLARKTHSYRMAKNMYIFLECGSKLPVPIHTKEVVIQFSKNENEETSDWNSELIVDLENAIKNLTINFQGNELPLDAFNFNWLEILDDETKCDILESKPLVVDSNKLLFVSGDYISRKFGKKALSEGLKNEIQSTFPQRTRERFLLYVKTDNIDDTITNEHNATFKNIDEARCHFQTKEIKKNWSYYFCSTNGSLELKWASGKHIEEDYTDDIKLTEEDLLIGDSFTILTSNAEAGKSETMKSLARKFKETNKCHCVYFLNLCSFIEIIERATKEDIMDPISFIAVKLLGLKTIKLAIFTSACDKSGKAAFFFDSFDMLSKIAREKFCKIFISLDRTNIAKIFISSRQTCVKEIEKSILLNSIEFDGFSVDEENQYMTKLLKENCEKSGETIDEKYKSEIISGIINHIKSQNNDYFLTNPIHIKFITSVSYYMNIIHGSTTDSMQWDLFKLNECFITLRVIHFYIKSLEAKWKKFDKGKRKRFIREKLRGSSELVCSKHYPDLGLASTKFMIDTEDALRDDLGLIIGDSDNKPQFVHNSMVEFFASELVRDTIDNKMAGIESISDNRYMLLRKFVNSRLILGN